uniref:RxLR effector candidate protein n=1 Tax=Hyaloperonospora arabidopsidis (strain Emoy2) TaxID=559515 RepID=M4C3S9_HYAAE
MANKSEKSHSIVHLVPLRDVADHRNDVSREWLVLLQSRWQWMDLKRTLSFAPKGRTLANTSKIG